MAQALECVAMYTALLRDAVVGLFTSKQVLAKHFRWWTHSAMLDEANLPVV